MGAGAGAGARSSTIVVALMKTEEGDKPAISYGFIMSVLCNRMICCRIANKNPTMKKNILILNSSNITWSGFEINTNLVTYN